MSVVKDLSKLPIGTKIEKIIGGEVIHTFHTTSLYEDFLYLLEDENENKFSITIKELIWGGYEIYWSKNMTSKREVPRNSY